MPKINQIYSILKDINEQLWGSDAFAVEDVSDLISLGKTIANAASYDAYLNALVDRIGKTVVRRLDLQLDFPTLYANEYQFGAILQKITVAPISAVESNDWNIGQTPFTPSLLDIHKPTISVKYFDGIDTASFIVTIPFDQMQSAFTGEAEMSYFFDSIIAALNDSLVMSINNMSRTCVNNFIAEKIKANNGIINLLTEYNATFTPTLTQAEAILSPAFLRFAAARIKKYIELMRVPSVLYNTEGNLRATSRDNMHILCQSEFGINSQVYLESDTYWRELLALPSFTSVPMWQANHTAGGDNDFATNSAIDIIPSSEEGQLSPTAVSQSGILMVLADRQAIAVGLNKRRSATFTNTFDAYTSIKEEFSTQWINDLGESGLIFICA